MTLQSVTIQRKLPKLWTYRVKCSDGEVVEITAHDLKVIGDLGETTILYKWVDFERSNRISEQGVFYRPISVMKMRNNSLEQ